MPPQGRKSAEEILGLAPRRRSAEEILGIQAPRKSAEEILAQPVGAAEAFGQEIAGGVLEQGIKPAVTLYDAIKSAASGDFQPLLDMAERTGRGFLQTDIGTSGNIPKMFEEAQAPRMAELRQRAEARLPEPIRSMEAGYRQEAARPRTTAGKVAGVAGQFIGAAGPAVATGILTGGSVPAIAATTAVQSAAQPENLALNVGAAVAPLPLGQLVAPILRRIRGAKGAEAAIPEAAGGVSADVAPSPSLAKAIGQDAFDDTRIAVEDLGLPHVPQPTRPNGAVPVRREIPVDSITLSRDELSRGRMYQAQEGLAQGVKGEGETFTTLGGNQRAIEPIQVLPDPQNPGRFIVEGDGNHRVALLKLQGNNDLIPVKSFETAAQSGAVEEATAKLTENYYRAPSRMPTLEEAAAEPFGVTEALGQPRRTPGAAGPRISEYGFVEGSNPGVVTPEERTPILKTLTALWKAGLLTRPNTHLKNIGGNAGFALSEEAARVPGAIADMIVSPISGRRTFTGLSPGAMARSAYQAATKGVSEAWQIIKNGITEADAQALQLKELNSGSKILDTYVNYVFRALNAEDRIFKVYAYRRALEDRARSIALNEIRGGQIARGQYGERVRELVQNTPEDLAASAIGDAEVATFTNENLVSGAVSKARNFLETTERKGGKLANAGLDVVLPFDKTPTNIVARLLEYTFGAPKAIVYDLAKAVIKRSMSEGEQRAFAQTFGRGTVGAGLIGLGALLYKKGLMTGFKEDDPSRRERDEAAGRIPGSILVGDQWHQVVGLAPVGNLMAIGATIQRESDQERDSSLKAYLEAGAQAVGEQPLLAGAQQVAGALKNPGTAISRALGGFAASLVPGAVSDVAQTLDTRRRQSDTLYRQAAGRIPILRNTLPERPDVLGQPVGLPVAFDPTKSTTAKEASDPLLAELVRLDHGISGFEKKKDETEEQHAEKVTTFGQLYTQFGLGLINSQPYQNADDATRKELFDLFNHRVKSVVTENEERFAQAKLSPAIIYQAFRESELRKRQKALQPKR